MRHCWLAIVFLGALGCGGGAAPPAKNVAAASSTTPAKSAAKDPAAATDASSASVPLRTGLTIVSAVSVPSKGDLESIHRITRVADEGVSFTVSGQVPVEDAAPGAPAVKPLSVARVVRPEDLQHAREYMQMFDELDPELFAGTTGLGVSTDVLHDLKTKGETHLTLGIGRIYIANEAGSVLEALPEFAGELNKVTKVSGILKRVEPGQVPFPLVLNDEPAQLPVIHARGSFTHMFGSREGEFWILDDPSNPLVLKYSLERLGEYQVVRISFPPEQPVASRQPAGPSLLARELAASGRATIYFDFASDRIKKESEPVLEEIARVLADNPDWSLAVEGHTDNVGGPERNLDLSTRRAAAVKSALMERHRIDPARLATAGHGESRPTDTNDTLEGRARNRRVELVRLP